MINETKLPVEKRKKTGGSAPRLLRKKGLLPCSISRRDGTAEPLQVNCREFEALLRRHAKHMILDIAIDGGKPKKALLMEVQRHPVNGTILHADFAEISMTKKLRTTVPVKLVGEPAGIVDGGILEHVLREIEVECLPSDLPEEAKADVSALKIGNTFLVGQFELGPKVTILTSKNVAVAAVNAPKAEEEAPVEAVAAEAAATPAEPEIVGKKEKEEEAAKEGKAAEEKSEEGGKKEKEGKHRAPAAHAEK